MWGILDFLLRMVKPASSRALTAKAPSAGLSTLEKDATRYHVEAMNYLRQAIYEKAEESALMALNTWKQLRQMGRPDGYGGYLTDRLAAERIKTLTEVHTYSHECKEISASIFSCLDTQAFLEQKELERKINCKGKKLIHLLHELGMAGLVEKREKENGSILWRKRTND